MDFSAYRGQIGDLITIQATDDFALAEVRVNIQNPDGTLVEEGSAVGDPDGFTFRYRATAANTSLAGDKITVTAIDRPGNRTSEKATL